MKEWKWVLFWPFRSWLLNILCDKVGSTHKALLLHWSTVVQWLSRGKAGLSCKLTSCFLHRTLFLLDERIISKPWSLDLGKQLIVPSDNIKIKWIKIKPWVWQLPRTYFSDVISGDINQCDSFIYCIMKCVNTWNLHDLVDQNFPNDQCMM